MDSVSLRLFRALHPVLPYSPAGADTFWVVLDDPAELQDRIASIPGKWNLVRRDKVGGGPPPDGGADGQQARRRGSNLGHRQPGVTRDEDFSDDEPEGAGHAAGTDQDLNAAGRAAAAADLLTADMLQWRHRYACDHAGKPQCKPLQPDISPRKRRRRDKSIKVGCLAKFVAFQAIRSSCVYIKWTFTHTGHDTSTLQSVAESRLPRRDWKAIRNLLRRLGPLQAVPEAIRIRRMDLLQVARKADDREVIQQGGISALNLSIPAAEGERTWAAHFATSWQTDMLLAHGQHSVVCMDSTHNTCFGFAKDEKVWLYSLVGIPCAFMPIIWNERLRFQPQQFMIDCSVTEVFAITSAFPRPAMTANSKLKVKGHGAGFMALMSVPDQAQFLEQSEQYLRSWSCCPSWVTYEQWARAWRQEAHRGVDTNNFMESWHNQLKSTYLGLMRKQGVDVFLWLLLRQCVPDYHASELRSDRKAKQRAMDLNYTEALALVMTVDSFAASSKLDALGDEHELAACSCPAFAHTHRILGLPLAQFSRKKKTTTTTNPSHDLRGGLPNSTGPAGAEGASSGVDDVLRVREERDLALATAMSEGDKIAQLVQRLKTVMLRPEFACSRARATELGARLETARDLIIDIVDARDLHSRQ
ncbi:hypothetical protein V8E36_005708 [Tilletia maclaganii]